MSKQNTNIFHSGTGGERFLHVDINAYFATLLQQENPALRGRPIGVVKERRRSCVIAASKEAKKFGVKTGCSAKEAKERAPGILFVPAAFPMYLHATKVLQKVFANVSPSVEIFSLDEAFIDLKDCARLYTSAEQIGRKVQSNIKQELGDWVTCNVGVGPTRFLAKLASETSPKGSVFAITPQNQDEVFATASFGEVCGVGYRLEKKLKAIGVTNLYMIQMSSDEELSRQVGPFWARELRKMVTGQETHLLSMIDHNDQMKSVGRSITGYKLCDDERTIKSILYNLVEEVTFKCRTMGLAGRQVGVSLWGGRINHRLLRADKPQPLGSGWGQPSHATQYWGSHETLRQSISKPNEMFSILYDKLYKSWNREFPIIKFGVHLGLLEKELAGKMSLFERERKKIEVMRAVDTMNRKHGLFTVRSGLLLDVPIIRPEVTGFLGDKQYQLGFT